MVISANSAAFAGSAAPPEAGWDATGADEAAGAGAAAGAATGATLFFKGDDTAQAVTNTNPQTIVEETQEVQNGRSLFPALSADRHGQLF